MSKTFRAFKFLAIAVVLFPAAPATAGSQGPDPVVRSFQAALIETMQQADGLLVQKRFETLAPRIDESFHLSVMVQIILGDMWEDAKREERERLIAAFRRMSISTLATLFDGYSGETFEITHKRNGPQNTILVETQLNRIDDSPVDIAYITKEFKIGWRIIDVIVDKGISEINVRRSEYRRILVRSGIEGLTNALNRKADSLLADEKK